MAFKVLKKRLYDFNKENYQNIWANPINDDDLFNWEASILGPDESPYEGGIFHLKMYFPTDFAFKPPKCYFTTKIYHPNISSNGSISLDVLMDQWSPATSTIDRILLSISSLLTDPNPDDFINSEAAELYKKNRFEYYKKARKWAIQYAGAPKKNNEFYYLNGKDRIDYELRNINNDKNFKLFSTNDSYKIKAIIESPKGSPYKNEKFELLFEIPQDYPFKPPSFYFIKSDEYEYLKSAEKVCNLILEDKWNHKLFIRDAIKLIYDYLDYNFINNMSIYSIVNELLDRIKDLESELNKEKSKSNNVNEIKNDNNQTINSMDDMKVKFEKIISETDKEISELKNKLSNNNFNLEKGEKQISIIISTVDENVNYSIICKNTDKFKKIEEQFYSEFPEYRDNKKTFTLNGEKIYSDKSIDENKIKMNSNIILLT